MLARSNRSADTLHTLLYPLRLSAEVTQNTNGFHLVQNWSGDELMRSGESRIVTSPGAMATKSA